MGAISTLFVILGMDFYTKKWAQAKLPMNCKKEVVKNGLYFWHIKNKGIAYNKCSGKRKEILLFTGGLLAYYSRLFFRSLQGKESRKYAIPLALVLGGGYGNFLERARKGWVTDFLFIPIKGRNAPIFNLADVAVWIGAICLTRVSFDEK